MQINYNQLLTSTRILKPAYIIEGNEPWQANRAHEFLLTTFEQAGFTTRKIFDTEAHFEWDRFIASLYELHLFATQTIIELRLNDSMITKEHGEALLTYISSAPSSQILLVRLNKLSAAILQAKWFKAIEPKILWVKIKPLTSNEFIHWLYEQINISNLKISDGAFQLLCELCNNNLPAAAQSVEKLAMTYPDLHITEEHISNVSIMQAKYTVFNLVDSWLEGSYDKTFQVLNGLKDEGTEPILILWAITRQLREILIIQHYMSLGQNFQDITYSLKIWSSKAKLIKHFIQYHPAHTLKAILRQAHTLDLNIKGFGTGLVWHELLMINEQLVRRTT